MTVGPAIVLLLVILSVVAVCKTKVDEKVDEGLENVPVHGLKWKKNKQKEILKALKTFKYKKTKTNSFDQHDCAICSEDYGTKKS